MSNANPPAQLPPVYRAESRPLLRTYKRAFVLLFFYIPLVLIPWVITMVLAYRPLTKPSWTYAEGFWWKDYKQMRGWATAIPIMNAFAAILTIPATSAIIAQAAVVFAQRRSADQHLSARHLFSLADRAWCKFGLLYNMLGWKDKGTARVNWFIVANAVLVVLGAAQYPFTQILVSWEEITIPTCRDTRYIRDTYAHTPDCDMDSSQSSGYSKIGVDLEPAQMANLPAHLILPRIVDDLSMIESDKALPFAWQDPNKYGNSLPASLDDLANPVFVTALPADTTTGTLREHVMRLNSSVSCNNLTIAAWPSTCSGTNPFQASFDYKATTWSKSNRSIDICAPGDTGEFPWILSRSRQELSEEVFFRLTSTSEDDSEEADEEEVVHCTARTTRGYFELGNTYNGGEFGPLLEHWSEVGESHDWMAHEYGGFGTDWTGDGYRPSEEDHYPGGAQRIRDDSQRTADNPAVYTDIPGPLMMSVLAIFGPKSWAHSVVNITTGKSNEQLRDNDAIPDALIKPMCSASPFQRTDSSSQLSYSSSQCTGYGLLGLVFHLNTLMYGWDSLRAAEARLHAAIYIANRATLTSHNEGVIPGWYESTGREIYSATGLIAWKPRVGIGAQVILTVIVGTHVLGLLVLGYWIQRWPAWTRTLDAMAIARVAARLDPSLLPPLRDVRLGARKPLAGVDGLVGVQEAQVVGAQARAAESAAERADIEMETLSIASTAGKQATSSAVSTAAAADTAADAATATATGGAPVTLGLGAPGCVAKRGKKQVALSAGEAGDV